MTGDEAIFPFKMYIAMVFIVIYAVLISKEQLLQSTNLYGEYPYCEHLKKVAYGRLIYSRE